MIKPDSWKRIRHSLSKRMRHRTKIRMLGILLPLLLAGILLCWLVPHLFNPNLYRVALEKTLTSQLGREVMLGKAGIGFSGGIGIAFEDVRIKDRSRAFDLFYSKRLVLTAHLLPLLRKEIKWKRITFEQPIVRLSRDREGRFNLFDTPLHEDVLKASQTKMLEMLSTLFGGSLRIRSGEVFFSDESLGGPPFLTEVRSLEIHLSKIALHKPFPFRIEGRIIHSEREGKFLISGMVKNLSEGMDLFRGRVEANVEAKGIEVFHFWPYLKPLLPMNKIAGILDLKVKYQGDLSGPFKASAKLQLDRVTYDHPQVFAYLFTPKWVRLEWEITYDQRNITVPQFSIELPELKVKGRGRIYGIGTEEMGLEAEASSHPFDIADGRRYIPFRIITPSVSDPLFRAEGSGSAQILSVKLSGKIPEIDHCDELHNAHVLTVEMKVNHARLKLPWNLPPLEDLKGNLLFKGGHLHLKEVKAKVFRSEIERAQGVFYELLQVPTLEIQGQGEFQLADLSSLLKTDIFAEDPEVRKELLLITFQSGKADYQMAVKGRLKSPLHFQHQGNYLLSKVRLTHPQIPFAVAIGEGRLHLSNTMVQWFDGKIEFGPSHLSTNGLWKRGGSMEWGAKGKLDLKNLLALSRSPLFPKTMPRELKEIESLSGMSQIAFHAKRAASSHPISYEVAFSPKEASLQFKGFSQPLLLRDGTLSLSPEGITFSKLRMQFFHSSFLFDGTIKQKVCNLFTSGFVELKHIQALRQLPFFPDSVRTQTDPIEDLAGGMEFHLNWSGRMEQGWEMIREGEVLFKGVSFRHQKLPVPFSQIEGNILFSPQQIRWHRLRGRLKESTLTLSGVLPRSSAGTTESEAEHLRKLSLHLTSPHLDLDLFFPKHDPAPSVSFKKLGEWLSRWSVEGKMDVQEGRYRDFYFKDFKCEMKTIDGRVTLHPFELKAFQGNLWGEAWLQPTEDGIRFEIKPRLSHLEVTPFLRTLLDKKEEEKISITGRIYVDRVQLRGEGGDFQKLKETLQGELRLELENGVIERGNILAKIFSLLNVSQLFKGRLPDLKTKGLPYQHIYATFQINNGVAFTDDFLVDSDAMRITAVGNVDLGRKRIDIKVGVHPLGTVDTILSNIPIAGYILTGKDKAFLSYVYEVKGDLDEPTIEPIPFKALGEGLIGIFKRLLDTPLRPFRKNNANPK